MSVEIDPQELGFHRPFTREVSQVLKIRNPNLTPIAFKVKTTAPKQYCVRPNSGRIEPGKEVEVSGLFGSAMKTEPPADTRCRDKFLVQSVAVTADKEFTNIAQIWQHVDQAEKSSVQEKKIRVVFLAEEGAGQTLPAVSTPLRNGVNTSGLNDTTPNTAAPQYHSPYQEESTQRSAPLSEATSNRSVSDSKSAQLRGESSPQPAEPAVSKAKENVKAIPAAVSSAMPNSIEELKAQLAQAQATIAKYGQEGGLRLRKAGNALGADEVAPAAQAAIRTTSQEGVPVKIVAALCFLSFLIAYFFF
ncbi:hypothetical protein V494_04353 [Pseudogymnoascus sp. VKM F-4513 (FW-928)]|nr:hypothetical protein V494_04353 [Pseudogymnoascus sp. VKM F-4513 (FW-928)]